MSKYQWETQKTGINNFLLLLILFLLIFINLIFNAIDAMPDGGTLELSSRYDTDREVLIVRVKDSGCGIPREDLAHIFEPFYTTKKEGYGVGLGLSTVYGIMEQHHGSVNVESRPGAGTAIMLELPVSDSNKGGWKNGFVILITDTKPAR